ncbi:AAEL014898-PA [Aedes aegypti]|uniref:AAEL014898-PA n=1 Tax=Aedes aegypti TaxID=7159 RepID=Q16F52_AEDAE|nr:AAEL014898-PA [Aedes aegypti]
MSFKAHLATRLSWKFYARIDLRCMARVLHVSPARRKVFSRTKSYSDGASGA